jgi:hypothetical protein
MEPITVLESLDAECPRKCISSLSDVCWGDISSSSSDGSIDGTNDAVIREKSIAGIDNSREDTTCTKENVNLNETSDAFVMVVEGSVSAVNAEGDLTNVWLGDSGATVHVCNDERFTTGNMYPTERTVRRANDEAITATLCGNVEIELANKEVLILRNCLYVPQLNRNIIMN